MIPYQDMQYKDWVFYWGSSWIFTVVKGKWTGVRPLLNDSETGEPLISGYLHRRTLETLGSTDIKLTFQTVEGDIMKVSPLTPFESDEWVTYEPKLGYFLFNDKLTLLTSASPRNRHRGLHQNKLVSAPAVDASALPKLCREMVTPVGTGGVDMFGLVKEIARRLNEGFPDYWGTAVLAAFKDNTAVTILSDSTAMVYDPIKELGHILFQGAMIGTVTVGSNEELVYTSRTPATSKLEVSVRDWVRSKLTLLDRIRSKVTLTEGDV
jgi:hypothetical protein